MKNMILKFVVIVTFILSGAISVFAQKLTITGTVLDELSETLQGVSVMIKGTSVGTVTNANGEFSIAVEKGQTLVFSFISFETQEVVVSTNTKLLINLVPQETLLDEVVVVGYGTMARKDLTGAISHIKSDELLSTPALNITEMLRGRVAGMTVTTTSGRPGSASNIYIRGKRSFGDSDISSEPLYVIDGVTSTSVEFNTLNPNDIVSVDIFKDAAAQAIYGTRAANGVVLITTKRGKAGKPEVKLDMQLGLQNLKRNFDFYNAEEWYTLRAHAKANDYDPPRSYDQLTEEEVLNDIIMQRNWAEGNFTDWEKAMFKTSLSQKYDLSVSGGTEKIKIYAGIGHLDQEGMLRFNSGYRRNNIRINTDYQVYDWLKIGFNTSFLRAKDKREDGDFNSFITRSPLGSIYNENGEPEEYINTSHDRNPVYNIMHAKREIESRDTRLSGFIEADLFKGFTYRFSSSWRNRFAEDGIFKDSKYPSGGTGSISNAGREDFLIDNIINYHVPFLPKSHKLSATAVQSYDGRISKGLSLEANNFTVDRDWNMIGDATISEHNRTVGEELLLSFVGRINYGFKDRYLLSMSIRRDGSSKFGINNKWASFPAASFAWRINEEPFMKNIEVLDNLKLRLSYGAVGNQNSINSYNSLGLATSYPYEFGDQLVMGYLPGSTLSNPNLKWETSITSNIGLDFDLFRGRLQGTLEVYHTEVKDLLVNRNINSALGYSSIRDNLGELTTNGVEFSISGDIIQTKDWNWNVAVNLSKTKQEIVKVNNLRDENGNYMDDIDNRWFVGYPEKVYYDYKFDGIFQETDFDMIGNEYYLKPSVDTDGDGIYDTVLEYPHKVKPGMIKVVDVNGDGKINSEDRTQFQREPDFMFSLNTRLRYKGFDIYADLFATTGGYNRNQYLYDSNSGGSLQGKLNGIKVHYWTKENPSNTFPMPSHSNLPTYFSVVAMQKTDYVRLRTLTVGYTLSDNIRKKMKINSVRVYATVTNLWTKTDYLSYSPELAPGSYPEPQSWVFGINYAF